MSVIHSEFPSGVIITKGLGLDATSGALITATKFHMFTYTVTIGGGSTVFQPGEIKNMYKSVSPDLQPEFFTRTKLDPLKKPKKLVVVKININNTTVEKEFLMEEKPYNALIKVINIYNKTSEKIKTYIHHIGVKANDIVVKLESLNKDIR